jgi:hypothetical protein
MSENNQNLNSHTQANSLTNNNPVGIEGNIALVGTLLAKAFNFITRSGVSTDINHPKLRRVSTEPNKNENILSKEVTEALFSESSVNQDNNLKYIPPEIEDLITKEAYKLKKKRLPGGPKKLTKFSERRGREL